MDYLSFAEANRTPVALTGTGVRFYGAGPGRADDPFNPPSRVAAVIRPTPFTPAATHMGVRAVPGPRI